MLNTDGIADSFERKLIMVYLCIVFDIATTLCTSCCHSVGNDRSHSPLSASLPTATRSSSSCHLQFPYRVVCLSVVYMSYVISAPYVNPSMDLHATT